MTTQEAAIQEWREFKETLEFCHVECAICGKSASFIQKTVRAVRLRCTCGHSDIVETEKLPDIIRA